MFNNIGCPKCSFLYFIRLTLIFDLCTSAPNVRVRKYIFPPHIFLFCSPIWSNSFLVFPCFFVNIMKEKTSNRKNVQLRESISMFTSIYRLIGTPKLTKMLFGGGVKVEKWLLRTR